MPALVSARRGGGQTNGEGGRGPRRVRRGIRRSRGLEEHDTTVEE